MSDEIRIQELLDNLESHQTPEDVCGNDADLLREVRARWERMRRLKHQIDELFPVAASTGDFALPLGELELPQIDGYEVESVLGRGGMGIVFKAKHRKLNRHVALKMMLTGPFAGPLERARFQREAEAVAALRHPNIVQIHDVGEVAGRHYFTMEFVEGENLSQKLAGKPQVAIVAAETIATLACAVQCAHQSGFIHRDLKPANILLTTDGIPKITDFGLVRSIEAGPEFTLSGARLGTPSYMAPEQAMGKVHAIGPAVDVYALGAVLYEMLTGRPPFEGESAAATERQVIADEPLPPSRLNSKVPRDLETICLKCLQKSPSRRYASAQDLADDLHRFVDGKPVLARPVGVIRRTMKWVRRRPTLATLVLTLLGASVVVAGTGLWGSQERNSRQLAARHAIENGIPRAYKLGQEEKWQDAKQVLADAQHHLESAESDELRGRFDRVQADLQFAEQLERIRQRHAFANSPSGSGLEEGRRRWAKAYAQAFAEARIDIDDMERTAATIRESELRMHIVTALDLWALLAFSEKNEPLKNQLLQIARWADPDPGWKDRFRDSAVWSDKQKLLQLAIDAANEPTLPAHQLAIIDGWHDKVDRVWLLRKALHSRESEFWLNWEMGLALLHAKNYPEAVTYFRIVVALRPDNPWNLNRLSGALSDSGQREEALALSRRAVSMDPNDTILRYNLAVELFRAKQFDEAQTECRRILAADPEDANAVFVLASTFHYSQRQEEAIPLYRRAIGMSPKSDGVWYNLGIALRDLGRMDEAAAAFAETVKLVPNNYAARLGLARTSFQLGRHEEAVTQFQWIIQFPDRGPNGAKVTHGSNLEIHYRDAWSALAESLCCLGRFTEARAAAQQALDRLSKEDPYRLFLLLRLDRCKRLVAVESKLPAILDGKELPTDVATQLVVAEWLHVDKSCPFAATRRYEAIFARQPTLADDLDTQHRVAAACAAGQAGCGIGEDAVKLDEATKAGLRQKAYNWLKDERDALLKRYKSGTAADQNKIANALLAWQQNLYLACLRDQPALAKLPETESQEWQRFWADVKEPPMTLIQARALAARTEWAKAARIYAHCINESRMIDGETLFEYAAMQLLTGDRQGYRQTCKQMLEIAPKNIRSYHAARACTLAPDSVDDAALPAQLSAMELQKFTTLFWSLTEQGALSYRANRFKEAVPPLKCSLEVETRSGAAVLNWLWLAMAYQKMGEKDEARRWLKKAQTWLDSLGNELPANSNSMGLHFHNWLETRILRSEAESLLSAANAK